MERILFHSFHDLHRDNLPILSADVRMELNVCRFHDDLVHVFACFGQQGVVQRVVCMSSLL